MSSGPIFLLFILLAAIVGRYYYTSTGEYIVRRVLRKIKRRALADVEDGEHVKIKGKIVFAGKTLTAPLSGRKCVYYHVVVAEQRRRNNHSQVVEIISDEQAGDVIIRDGDSYAFVDQRLVYTYIVKDVHLETGFFQSTEPAIENYMRRHKHKSEGGTGFGNHMTFKEGVLEDGETVVVSGQGTWESRHKFGFKLPAEKILHLKLKGDTAVYLSDDSSTA